MSASTVSWGIEIGAAAIKAIKLEAEGEGRVKVLEFAVIQHPKPLSMPGVDPADILRVSLGSLVSQYDLSKATVAVSVPGHSAFARFAKLPPVEPKKVPDIVKFEAMQQIPFSLDDVEWDYQTFVSPDSPEVEVGIFAVKKDTVAERLTMLSDVGINASHVVVSPIAVYNALAYDLDFGAETPGTIIVDVGTTSTDLVVAVPGRMWVRTFPIGGHQFTQALVDQFQLSYPKAEKLKKEAEDSKHARQVFQAMRPVFTDLAQDIQRSIGYYQSLNKDAKLTRLIGVGSTFNVPGLRKYLKQQLSMDVYRIEEFKRATLVQGDPVRQEAFKQSSLELCTAYGLALHGLGLNAVGGNLMPVSVLRRAMWKEKVPWFGLAAGLAAAAGLTMFVTPVNNYLKITGNQEDPIINTALRSFDDAKKSAQDAGVIGAGEPDYRAANMIALLDRRDVFEYIVGDVDSLVATARGFAENAKESGADPIRAASVLQFDTEYRPGQAGDASMPGAETSSDPADIRPFPRIVCTLRVSTNQPDARRFARDVLEVWRKQNAARAGVPYVIMAPEQVVGDGARLGMAQGGQQAFPAGTGGGIPMGKGVAPGFDQSNDKAMQAAMEERMRNLQRLGGKIVGGGEAMQPIPTPGGGGSPNAGPALQQLNSVAPLMAPSVEEPGGVITFTWYAVFKPEQSAGATGKGG